MKKLKLKIEKSGKNFCSKATKILDHNFSFFPPKADSPLANIFHFSFHQSKSSGFTLMEMVVALGIFSSIMLMSIGALVSVQSAQIRSSDAQVVQDNIRFALELMTKEIRQGKEYKGYNGGVFQLDCSLGCNEMRFTKTDPVLGDIKIAYCIDAGRLIRSFNIIDGQNCSAVSAAVLTAEEATVEGFLFYILGQDVLPIDGQARVTITMRVRAKSPSQKVETVMDLQTTIVQRLREG